MTHADVIAYIDATRVIAILRGELRDSAVDIAAALVESGIRALEISIVSPCYAQAIGSLASKFGNRLAVGAGTVLTEEQCREVADCGASFIVSPNCDPNVIAATRRLGMTSFPGAFTPTEIVLATRAGADAIKIFPADSAGPNSLELLRGPFPDLRFIPTGGIRADNAASYFAAGAWALGVGSELVSARDFQNPDAAALIQKARVFLDASREGANA